MTGGLTRLTLAEARDGLAAGDFSAVALTAEHLDAMARARALNAYITETPDIALGLAEAADARRAAGKALGPLDGIPIAVKDLFCTEGVQTTAASHILEGFTPTYESTVTRKLREGGAVMLGKTNLDEFAMGSSNETSHFGPVKNPWGPKDGQGPGAGRLVRRLGGGGGRASLPRRHRHRHRRVDPPAGVVLRRGRPEADLRALLALGHHRLRLVARPGRTDDPNRPGRGDHAGRDGRLRSVGLHLDAAAGAGLRGGDRAAACAASGSAFPASTGSRAWPARSSGCGATESHGCATRVRRSSRSRCRTPATRSPPTTSSRPPRPPRTSPATTGCASACACRARTLDEMYQNTRGEGFGAEVQRRILIGTYVLSAGYYDAYYLKAQKVRALIARDFNEAFKQVDVILTPTTPSDAFAIGDKTDDPITMYLNDVFTVPTSLAGLPGISVPAGLSARGLPLGLQLIGRPFDEETVLRAAAALEQAAGFVDPHG